MVTIEGVTTNGFQAELFDEVIKSIGKAFGINSQQSKVSIKVLETSGDYDVERGLNNVSK